MTKYQVRLFLTTYTEHIVEAEDEAEAYAKAEDRFKDGSVQELGLEALANAECWPDADTIEKIEA